VSGVLGGSRDVNFTGALNWTGGTMGGAGRTTVTNTGTLTISGPSYGKTLNRNLDLWGAGTFSGTTFNGGNGAVFTVFNGATYDWLDNSSLGWTGGGGQPTLQNAGLIRKLANAGQGSCGFILNNNGIVRSQVGTLAFGNGGLSTGNFDVMSNAVVAFNGGTHTMTNGISFTSTTGYFLCTGGTLAFETPYVFNPQFNLEVSGVLGGSRDVNFTGALNWTGGTMGGAGRTTVTNTGTLTISGPSYGKVLNRNLDLWGAGTFSGTTFNGGNGAVFTVFNGATYDWLDNSSMGWTGGGGQPVLLNAGTVRKTGGVGTGTCGFITTNTGTFSSQSGTLNFQNTYTQNGGETVLSGGHYQAVFMNINGGSLSGGGRIDGPVRNNGSVHPGAPFTILSVTNNFNFTNTSPAPTRTSATIACTSPARRTSTARLTSRSPMVFYRRWATCSP
jgi:predicted heme/steroid binding protein